MPAYWTARVPRTCARLIMQAVRHIEHRWVSATSIVTGRRACTPMPVVWAARRAAAGAFTTKRWSPPIGWR
ncbi:hypothetical protein M8494_11265 [Serratia ureilytica]